MSNLAAGVQYGLSAQNTFYNDKELVLVKLTDSAQRAIGNYLRNKNNIDQKPTIQFHGGKGQIVFPSQTSHSNFTFSLSSNQDGGFECIQQTGPKNLEKLGTLPCKMQIQANDDVYETTKQRLHVVEENNKNKATRVIKSNEPMRKRMKISHAPVRGTSLREHSNVNVSSKLQDSKFSRASANQPSRFSASFKSSNSNSTGSNLKVNDPKKPGNVIGRPLKERLIHLLALKPFKKIELHDRINREGIKEKDKNTIEKTLKEISQLRDNAYHLKKYLWNYVQEEWPFYSEQEKVILKRQKPQNLTPPTSSDGASNGSNEENNTNSFQVLDKPGMSVDSVTFGNSHSSIYKNSTQYQKQQKPEQKQNYHHMNGKKTDNRYEKSSLMKNLISSDYVDYKTTDNEDIDKVKSSENVEDNKFQQKQPNHLDSVNNQSNYEPLDNSKNELTKSSSTFSTPSSVDEECTDFKADYTKIISYEQRRRYKTEYTENLVEYQQLSMQVDGLNSKFRELGEKWRRIQNCDESLAEEVKEQIYKEYANARDVKVRHTYLYEKLNYIMKLIDEYDKSIAQQ